MTQIDLASFEERLDRHGADLAAWPDPALATAARRLVLADPEARRLWEEARELALLLGADRAALDALVAEPAQRVAEALQTRRPLPRVAGPRNRLLRPAAGLAAALLLGGLVGLSLPNLGAQADDTLVVALDQFAFGSYEDLQP